MDIPKSFLGYKRENGRAGTRYHVIILPVDDISNACAEAVAGFSIEGVGDIDTIAKVSKKAQEFSMWASEKQREECPISDLWISVKCGESDTTSGLASNPTVGN